MQSNLKSSPVLFNMVLDSLLFNCQSPLAVIDLCPAISKRTMQYAFPNECHTVLYEDIL